MQALMQAITEQENITTTENGMKAFKSSLNANVDLFYKIGASRGKDIIPAFSDALSEDLDTAIRIALWARDVREGAGERQLFKDILKYLAINDYQKAIKLIPLVPEIGRWDDLLVLHNTPAQKEAWDEIAKAIRNGDGLCAKWMPRKKEVAESLRKHMNLTPKNYRKTLVQLTNVVEQKMCANKWTEIEYSKLPSLASARYQKAFGRHDQEGYEAFISSLQKGETKINAGAVYPYDILKSLYAGNEEVANEQWKALPDFVNEGSNFLPVIDVSGSMGCPAGGNKSITCMDVAISLGIYLAERNKSAFKDFFITFHERPSLLKATGTFKDKVVKVKGAPWGGNTNFLAVFKMILEAAKNNNLKQEDMPTSVIVLSDMQFDEADGNKAALGSVKALYREAGYEVPQLVFWNLNDRGNTPCKFNKEGVMLVSGFSPSLMKNFLEGKNVTPLGMMMEVVGKERYNWNK